MSLNGANTFRSRGYAMQGGLFVLSLMPLALITLHIFGAAFSFLFVPLIGVYLWPRHADMGLSYIIVFCLGLCFDFASDGPLGFWPLINLITLSVLRPDTRTRDIDFWLLWTGFVIWGSFIGFVLILAHKLLAGSGLWVGVLIIQLLTVFLMFPVIYYIRQLIRQMVIDMDDPYYR